MIALLDGVDRGVHRHSGVVARIACGLGKPRMQGGSGQNRVGANMACGAGRRSVDDMVGRHGAECAQPGDGSGMALVAIRGRDYVARILACCCHTIVATLTYAGW